MLFMDSFWLHRFIPIILVIVWMQVTSDLDLRVQWRSLPPEVIVRLQAVCDDLVEGLDEAVETLHLLGHVLIVLKSLLELPREGGRDDQKCWFIGFVGTWYRKSLTGSTGNWRKYFQSAQSH